MVLDYWCLTLTLMVLDYWCLTLTLMVLDYFNLCDESLVRV